MNKINTERMYFSKGVFLSLIKIFPLSGLYTDFDG